MINIAKSDSFFYSLLFLLFLEGCGNKTSDNQKDNCPLQAVNEFFSQMDQKEIHFDDLNFRLNDAKGKGNMDVVNAITKEFDVAQKECLKKLDEKFPIGSIKLPFEQTGSRDTLIVKSAYLSGFVFPWNTATSISYYFTIEYDLIKKDIWFAKIPVTFIDSEGDILSIVSVPADSGGKASFAVMGQNNFIKFVKMLIN